MSHYVAVAGADIKKGQTVMLADDGLLYPATIYKEEKSIPSDSWMCCGMTMTLNQRCKVCGDPSE